MLTSHLFFKVLNMSSMFFDFDLIYCLEILTQVKVINWNHKLNLMIFKDITSQLEHCFSNSTVPITISAYKL